MGEVITIGLDIAKSIFQVHGVDEAGAILIRKRISRAKMLEFFANLKPCLVGIEACPAAHHWGRELQALGHTVKLMPSTASNASVSLCLPHVRSTPHIRHFRTRSALRI